MMVTMIPQSGLLIAFPYMHRSTTSRHAMAPQIHTRTWNTTSAPASMHRIPGRPCPQPSSRTRLPCTFEGSVAIMLLSALLTVAGHVPVGQGPAMRCTIKSIKSCAPSHSLKPVCKQRGVKRHTVHVYPESPTNFAWSVGRAAAPPSYWPGTTSARAMSSSASAAAASAVSICTFT